MSRNRAIAISDVFFATAALGSLVLQKKKRNPSLTTAAYVDLNRFIGEWFEIARFPSSSQQDCYATKAVYSINDDGTIKVVNTCVKNGKLKQIEGRAFIKDNISNAKLKVQFFWPFKGDYWILEVGNKYEYALVGTPDRENLWIMSRSPEIDTPDLDKLINSALKVGFNTSKLIYTDQKQFLD